MYTYLLEPRAQLEYEDAIDWYANKNLELALKFIDSVDVLLDLICKQPLQFKSGYKHFHEAYTKRFPFAIIYTITRKTQKQSLFSPFSITNGILRKSISKQIYLPFKQKSTNSVLLNTYGLIVNFFPMTQSNNINNQF